ncbi:MAG: 3'-5' exonuclease [Phycisphaerae bacterium]|nr:3'-5' exonuclease [Phycisphaerae bacterium]
MIEVYGLDRIIFTARRFKRACVRRRLTARADGNPVIAAQSTAWPDRRRLKGEWGSERFVIFDTETTGLDPGRDHAVSLGAVSMTGGRIALGDTFDRIIAADAHPSRHSIVVHGLTPPAIAKGHHPQSVLSDFLLWAGDAVLLAHHSAFDMIMLNRTVEPLCGAPIQNLVLDTAHLAGHVDRRRGGFAYDLDSLLDRYDIPRSGGRHTALGDALLTARLLQKLLKILAARRINTLAELALCNQADPPGPATHL